MPTRDFASRRAIRHAVAIGAVTLASLVACGGDSTTEPEEGVSPALSILYSYSPDGRTPRGLYLTTADGKTTRSLPALGGDAAYPAWRPDGRAFVVAYTQASTKLLVANEDGSNAREIPGVVTDLARWSPDGELVVFASNGSSSAAIEEIHPDGTARLTITYGVGDIAFAFPTWSTHGVVLARRIPNLSTAIMTQSGGNLTSGPDDEWPAFSPDGNTIAFSKGSVGGANRIFEIAVMNADGSGQRTISNDGASVDLAPTWSPDGRWILYERWSPDRSRCSFVRIPAGGGTPVVVVPGTPTGACGGASWR
jgi:Tol biopolymer transport system component